MKAKHFVILLFVVGLVLAVTGLLSPAIAQDSPMGNLEEESQDYSDVTIPESPFDPFTETAGAPQTPTAGGTYFIGTCYSSPLLIPAAAFSDDGYDPDSFFFSFSGGYIQGDSQNYGCVMAPVNLPNGATITAVYARVLDNDATYNVNLYLRRLTASDGSTTAIAQLTTSGSSSSLQTISDTTITDPLVTYPDYAYYLTICLNSSDVRLYTVVIYYDGPS